MYSQIKNTKKGEVLATFLLLLTIFAPCYAEPHDIFCQNTTKTYNLSSPFGANLKGVLADLSSKTPRNEGFYSTSSGNDSAPVVYGRALCRGDVTTEVCQNCLQNITQEIIKECPYEGAIMWYELCQVEYSYKPLTLDDYAGKFPSSNDAKGSVSEPEHFQFVLTSFITELSTKAAYDSKLKFATGERKVSSTVTIYGLLQCTRDLSTGKCRSCLTQAAGDLSGCCKSYEGGTVFSKNCNVRFELNKFYRESNAKGSRKMGLPVEVALVATLVIIVLVGGSAFYFYRCRKGEVQTDDVSQTVMLHTMAGSTGATTNEETNIVSHHGLPFMEFAIVKAATENFSDSHKLGNGSFGTVYKGVLPNGKDLAVKRLSRKSWQGMEEFKNEIKLIAKLQHRNLVKLLCCSIEEDEKLLIYEYMPNKSLDLFIFDATNRSQLGWDTRFGIINGIARGLLYLHEDSRLKIIHRDLKPSNVLLDRDMVAKISDFGMARIFYEEETTENTKRVIGTYGYMAPEYAMGGQFSVKSDVYSFGVILLEIISGKKNSGFYLTKHAPSLLEYAWRLWNEGTELELVDALLTEACPLAVVVRCIHIALLCVQEDPAERPTMSSVVVLLADDTSLSLPQPGRPAFSVSRHQHDKSCSTDPSMNCMTISSVSPR